MFHQNCHPWVRPFRRSLPADRFEHWQPIRGRLKQQAIQIGFGGPGDDETNVRALAARVLSTLDGPLNR